MAVLGAAAGYSIYDDPKMPAFTVVYQQNLGLWGGSYGNTFQRANTQDFYVACGLRGSTVNASAVAANTWMQIMSVTGSGFLGTVIFPQLTNNNASTWTIELTIDGVVTERTTPSLGSFNTRRLVFGNIVTGASTNNATLPVADEQSGRYMPLNGYWNNYDGLGGKIVSTGSADYMSVVPVDIQMKRGQPVLKFNTNLTVRIKSNNATAYDANYQKAAALYIVNP